MDLSALESSVKALEISLDSVEGWITISTVLVVVGLVIEYWFPLRELIEEIRKRPPFPWKLLLEMVGGVLVTVGVAGELLFQSRASNLQAFIRSDSHQIEALLNKEASDARLEAANANKDAGDAKERAGKLEVQAATLRKQAEDERLERKRLEARVAPRSLDLKQQRMIIAALRQFSSHPPVVVSSYGLDGEGAALGAQVIAVLASAGIKTIDARAGSISSGGFENGVHIRGPTRETAFISGLENALHEIGKLQVFVNGPTVRQGAVMSGRAMMSGKATLAGGGE